MGDVYSAEDTLLHRKVAIKVLPSIRASSDAARERFKREAEAAAALNHPNIVTIFETGEHDGTPFIAMELISGKSLTKWIDDDKCSIDRILDMGIGVAQGLDKAHRAGIVHRDLKPSNILVDDEGSPRILDFGIAKIANRERITQSGNIVGTLAYMSPEQTQGDDTDSRTDIWSLGVILYELLTIRRPFTGERPAALAYEICNESPHPISRYNARVPAELQMIVARCLAKDPAERYQTAADLAAALRSLRRSRDGTSTVSGKHILFRQLRMPRAKSIVITAAAIALIVLGGMLTSRLLKNATTIPPDARTDSPVLLPYSNMLTPEQNRLAVMYFENLADSTSIDRLGEIVTHLLITDLSRSSSVRIVSSQRLYDVLRLLGHEGAKIVPPELATAVARTAEAQWMVMGSILRTKPNLIITTQLVEVETGEAVATHRISGHQGEDIFQLVERLTSELKTDLSIPATSGTDQSIVTTATNSLEAYRVFLEGTEYRDQYDFDKAVTKFRHVIQLDSTFALAYFQLARSSFRSPFVSSDDARRYIRHAKSLTTDTSSQEYLHLLAMDASLRDDAQEAIDRYSQIASQYPDDKEAWYTLGHLQDLWLNNQVEAVKALTRAVELDPHFKLAYNSLAYAYSRLGEYEKSLWAINRYIELAPDDANPYDSRGELYAFDGRLDEAIESFEKALTIDPGFRDSRLQLAHMLKWKHEYSRADSIYSLDLTSALPAYRAKGRLWRGTLLTAQGRFTEAIAYLDSCIIADELTGQYADASDKALINAALCLELGDTNGAMRYTKSAKQKAVSSAASDYGRACLTEIKCYAKLGLLDSARGLRNELAIFREDKNPFVRQLPLTADAIIAVHQGNTSGAARIADQLMSLDFRWDNALDVAVIYLDAGELGEGVSMLEQIEEYYDTRRSVFAHLSAQVHFYLGIGYERSGWKAKAIEKYEHFLSLWQNGDSELIKVADARERLNRLRLTTD